jgi:predicted ribosomally synthesized peptide with nif11-like leader
MGATGLKTSSSTSDNAFYRCYDSAGVLNPIFMSQEQLKAFLEKVQADTSLQAKLKAEGADPVAIAKAAGFTISLKDIHREASELSEDELEAVSGGTVTLTVAYTPALIIATGVAAK